MRSGHHATTPTGFLVLDKPAGPSSMSAVSVVRRRAGRTKTGHGGTLDPLATGVLVLGLGRATKLLEQVVATDKGYETEIDLSITTPTDDLEGDARTVEVATPPDFAALEAALASFGGEFLQRPPAFSAVKVGGRRAYALARKDQSVDIPARPVRVHHIGLLKYDWPVATVEVRCGKGFYVRSLARDLGERLGTGGCCRRITRTAVGPFTLDEAVPLDDVPDPLTQADLISVDEALARITPPRS
ncbi:MAG: tRNA pseudouridine(55) synthase TruB [Phycisphaerales bacterium]|nr:tRNA pseudouridine(55) synthase TruB [Phycisphaerales bacterium]